MTSNACKIVWCSHQVKLLTHFDCCDNSGVTSRSLLVRRLCQLDHRLHGPHPWAHWAHHYRVRVRLRQDSPHHQWVAAQQWHRHQHQLVFIPSFIASSSQRVSLIVIPFCLSVCLDVCRSFRDLQPTTIDRSQPNLVGRYTGWST